MNKISKKILDLHLKSGLTDDDRKKILIFDKILNTAITEEYKNYVLTKRYDKGSEIGKILEVFNLIANYYIKNAEYAKSYALINFIFTVDPTHEFLGVFRATILIRHKAFIYLNAAGAISKSYILLKDKVDMIDGPAATAASKELIDDLSSYNYDGDIDYECHRPSSLLYRNELERAGLFVRNYIARSSDYAINTIISARTYINDVKYKNSGLVQQNSLDACNKIVGNALNILLTNLKTLCQLDDKESYITFIQKNDIICDFFFNNASHLVLSKAFSSFDEYMFVCDQIMNRVDNDSICFRNPELTKVSLIGLSFKYQCGFLNRDMINELIKPKTIFFTAMYSDDFDILNEPAVKMDEDESLLENIEDLDVGKAFEEYEASKACEKMNLC